MPLTAHRRIAIVALAVVGAACQSDGGIGASLPYAINLQFKDDSTEAYHQPECYGSGDPYCQRWVPSARTFSGALELTETVALLTADDATWSAPGQDWKRDSLFIELLPPTTRCGRIHLKLTRSAGSVTGTFLEVHDCHSRSSAGMVTGQED